MALLLLSAVEARAEPPASAPRKAQTKVVIVPLTAGAGVNPKAAEVLATVIVAELSDRGVSVVTSKDVEVALEVERRKQVLGSGSSQKLDELAAAMGTDRIITGSIAMMGGYTVITIQLFDSRSGAIARVFQEQLERAEADDLLEAGGRVGDQLFPGTVRASGGPRRLGADAASLRLRSSRDVACSVDGGLRFPVVKDREAKMPVNPGQRVVRCSTTGYTEFVRKIDLDKGTSTTVQVEVYDAEAARKGRRNGYLSLGLAALGGGAAGYGFWQAHDAYDRLHGAQAPQGAAARQSVADRGQLGNRIGVAGSVALGLGAGLAAYFFLFSF